MKVLIGQLFHEGNSFNPLPTTMDDFVVYRGTALLDAMRGSGSIIGGIIHELEQDDVEIVPSIAACARPGGPVEHTVYEEFKRVVLETTRESDPELIVLELHGAMTTTEMYDAEGDLLESLRQVVGPDMTISVGLDLHALVTVRMLKQTDFLTACKHNPHSDYVETGRMAANLALKRARGEIAPKMAAVRIPMLLAGSMGTKTGPLRAAHDMARQATGEHRSLLDVSIFNVIPLLDTPEMGQVVIAITDNDEQAGNDTVRGIAELLWRRRSEFRDDFLSVDEALDLVAKRRVDAPFVIADYGDRVLSGAPGDSTEILSAVLARKEWIQAAIPITDPISVAEAVRAGVGGTVELSVGGLYTKSTPPITLTGRVRRLSDGCFVMKGPYFRGQETSMGETAIVETGPTTLMLTSKSALTQDVNAFESQGISIKDQDLVVTKSGYHFELSFEGIATPLKVETKGLGLYRPGRFSVSRPPLYPEIDPENPVIETLKG